MNRENLLKLADYLEGPLMAKFDMSRYTDGVSNETCGSVGCAIGHGPFIGLPRREYEDWADFAYRVFNIRWPEYEFLFCSDWAKHRNTPKETSQRIRYFVDHGVPEDWHHDYKWEPPVEQPIKQEPKVIYKTVVIDKEVVKLQTELRDN